MTRTIQDEKLYLAALKYLYLTRILDDKLSSLAKQNKGGNFHLSSNGHELIGVIGGLMLQGTSHWGFPYYRDRGFALAKGASVKELVAAFLARDVANHSGSKQMPEHYSDSRVQLACQSSVVGSQMMHAVGAAKASKIQGDHEISYVSFGDGATSQGDFHEALNFASIHKLPVIFCLQDNGFAISVTKEEQTTGGSILPVAEGYADLKVFDIDGCNIDEVVQAYKEAIARSGIGPSLISAKVPRLGPHSSSDNPKKYKSDALTMREAELDPLKRVEALLIEREMITKPEAEKLYASIFDEIEKEIEIAECYPFADEIDESDAFAASKVNTKKRDLEGPSVIMSTQINHALCEEMERDERIVVFGQDVARNKGGVFGVTEGLTARFGEKRCFNSTLAESTIIGTALGMALKEKVIPVCEIQFADYIWTGVNQLFNEVASFYFRSNGVYQLPIVIRMPCGGYIQGGPYHSQSIEAVLAHIPGLKVVMPSTAADAKRLLKGAIRDPNPVVFLEHKALYRQHAYVATPEPNEDEVQELGKAKIVREGDEMTIITWGMMTLFAVEIVRELKLDIEIIDLMTISPYDEASVIESVKKTGKVLVLHEAIKHGGFGAEVCSNIVEKCFDYLDAAPRRIGALKLPVPYSKELEGMVLPQKEKIKEEIQALLAY